MEPSPDGRRVYAGARPAPPAVVVVGAASRDLTEDDPRGWRLGGGVTYAGLALARLGVRTACVVGLDEPAATAWELEELRRAGAEVALARLGHGPVFRNIETASGRVQACHSACDSITPPALPEAWRDAGVWFLAPVADELDERWAQAIPEGARVVLGWQGLLRELEAGGIVRRRAPAATPLVRRADLVGLSVDDVDRDTPVEVLISTIRPGARLLLTRGDRGGWLVERAASGGQLRFRDYPAIAARPVDPTGAGDTFLAALVAAGAAGRSRGEPFSWHAALRLAATVAALTVEGTGVAGVPTRDAVRARLGRVATEPAGGA